MTDDTLLEALHGVDGLVVRTGEPLGRHNLLRVGGPVDLWLVAETEAAAVAALGACKAGGVKVRALDGEHWLARDEGLEGACLVLGAVARTVEVREDGEVRAGGRVAMAALAEQVARSGLTGLERHGGRPGTVAEAVAAGQLGDAVRSLRVLRGARATTVSPDKLKSTHTVITVDLVLGLELPTTVLAHTHTARRSSSERPGRLMADPDRQRADSLIAEAGLRGVRLRSVRVGNHEPNCLVNLGGATARDVALVLAMIRDRVKHRTGADLAVHVPHLGRAQAAAEPQSRSKR